MRNQAESSMGFVLHTYPFSETSLIVETFTRSHGRVVAMAKGAKRPTSAMRHALNPFQGLRLSWFGKAEMKTLKTAEHERIYPQLSGAALMSAFYMNELLLKLAHREDAHEQLFDQYEQAIERLASLPPHVPQAETLRDIAICLRRFELSLLRELGYALQLQEEADTRTPVRADAQYVYVMERGPMHVERVDDRRRSSGLPATGNVAEKGGISGDGLQLRGKTLLDMADADFSDPITLQQSKQLMRRAVNHLLGDKHLHTRQLIRDLKDF
jgi:DNA repair protein RecO (recombination protein O)